jgi:hypothetical protein
MIVRGNFQKNIRLLSARTSICAGTRLAVCKYPVQQLCTVILSGCKFMDTYALRRLARSLVLQQYVSYIRAYYGNTSITEIHV